jgi:hypothetical protein
MEFVFESILTLYLIIDGIYSIYKGIRNEKTSFWGLSPSKIIPKRIFGKENFNKFQNIFWGSIELILGGCLLKFLFFN